MDGGVACKDLEQVFCRIQFCRDNCFLEITALKLQCRDFEDSEEKRPIPNESVESLEFLKILYRIFKRIFWLKYVFFELSWP